MPYFEASLGGALPLHVNPAEFLLEQLNLDFEPTPTTTTTTSTTSSRAHALQQMQQAWEFSAPAEELAKTIASCHQQRATSGGAGGNEDEVELLSAAATMMTTTTTGMMMTKPSFASTVLTLLHRSFIKSYRDVIAYGVRAGMYLGLALMMGTVWVRLGTGQEYIQPYINAIVSNP